MAAPIRLLLGLATAVWLGLSSAAMRAEEVTIFAAASTTDALTAVVEAYRSSGRPKVRTVFAASSTLAKQILQGAPADLFLSASPAWMDYLEDRNGIERSSRLSLLANRLALIAPANAELTLDLDQADGVIEALGSGRLALGDPDHVPAGVYGKAALTSLGLWAEVASQTARAANVRAAVALVERGEAVAGIVYLSDARNRDRVRVVTLLPEGSHPPITYPIAVVRGRDTAETKAFAEFLKGEAALSIFRRHGFAAPGGS